MEEACALVCEPGNLLCKVEQILFRQTQQLLNPGHRGSQRSSCERVQRWESGQEGFERRGTLGRGWCRVRGAMEVRPDCCQHNFLHTQERLQICRASRTRTVYQQRCASKNEGPELQQSFTGTRVWCLAPPPRLQGLC